eukprot:TRINITY_DN14311_c1_g1_i4.p1 TRINITY_DN14311_c1_g1~~TRINITY_DN14311_c1_g1_i4.p1  ORF type:complete len:181 (+),score=11.36 TRINITY_DN14311_c1_g1_i4:196-738(+)
MKLKKYIVKVLRFSTKQAANAKIKAHLNNNRQNFRRYNFMSYGILGNLQFFQQGEQGIKYYILRVWGFFLLCELPRSDLLLTNFDIYCVLDISSFSRQQQLQKRVQKFWGFLFRNRLFQFCCKDDESNWWYSLQEFFFFLFFFFFFFHMKNSYSEYHQLLSSSLQQNQNNLFLNKNPQNF